MPRRAQVVPEEQEEPVSEEELDQTEMRLPVLKAEDYECPQSNGLFADPKTCRRFINCVEKFPYLSNCPGGLFFDDISKACTFRNEATCGPISTTEAPSTTQSPDAARKCERNQCQLPNCFCSPDGTGTPDDMNPRDIPQMIVITLDGAINLNNFRTYKDLFNYHDLVNPNGCPIRGTFFITHEYSNYQQIQDLYADGHEIALHTITLRRGLETADYETWTNEMIGMREILRKFGNISLADILGMRAPYLQPGKNVQYEMMFSPSPDSKILGSEVLDSEDGVNDSSRTTEGTGRLRTPGERNHLLGPIHHEDQ
ncbi:unnamed protein product [Cyprideis torosa]|uniref:Uncharacterized protein n=1 Tax=Cyprideis torosa TaxID=163714 RepID=A0A7R8WFT5_9CRUS|nr:unnamed protein product [Cyprideis torosa]CAG0892210.1 unnamed protein product [Cyprideis torosa]